MRVWARYVHLWNSFLPGNPGLWLGGAVVSLCSQHQWLSLGCLECIKSKHFLPY